MPTPDRYTTAEFADLCHVSPQTVKTWERKGWLIRDEVTRHIIGTESIALVDRKRQVRSSKRGHEPTLAVVTGTSHSLPPDSPEPDVSREEAERRKVLAQAQLAELELALKEGRSLDAEAVARTWVAHAHDMRASVRNLPPRLAAAMHGLDLVAAEAVALREVDALLTEIADNPPEVK